MAIVNKDPKELISFGSVKKSFRVGTGDVPVLKGIDISIKNGDFVVIIGPSGSGKSTVLHTLLGLEPPTEGDVSFLGFDLYDLDQDDRAEFRRKNVGIIYQQSYWVKSLNVMENVSVPLLLNGVSEEIARDKALESLEKVGMLNWAEYVPTELSAGQQQKVGLARALITNPLVLVADEPTGNLDSLSGDILMKMLQELNTIHHKTIIMVTHDLQYIPYSTRALVMKDGIIEQSVTKGQPEWKDLTLLKSKK